MPLKFLFHCQFNDGEYFHQQADDRSEIDDKRSSFFDLLQDTRTVERFWLLEQERFQVNISEPLQKYLVDLTDGHFEENGKSFFQHDPKINVKLSEFRLIYFRRRTAHLNLKTKQASEDPIIFVIGWQANHPDGRNEKQLIYIQ